MTQDPKKIIKKKNDADDEFIEWDMYKRVSGNK